MSVNKDRRKFLKKAAYVAPAVMTMATAPDFSEVAYADGTKGKSKGKGKGTPVPAPAGLGLLGLGLLLIRPLEYYPMTAVLIITCGIFVASYMTVNLGKGSVATFLIIALTLISSIGTLGWGVAVSLIDGLALGQ